MALAGKIRHKHQPIRATRHRPSQCAQIIVAAAGRNCVVQPAHATRCAQHHAHVKPLARHGVAERVQASIGFGLVLIIRGKHHARRPNRDARLPALQDTTANRGGRLVARAANDRCTYAQTRCRRASRAYVRAHLGAFAQIGQERAGNIQRGQQFVRPRAAAHVHQRNTRAIRHIGDICAGQQKAHIVLGQQNVRRARKRLGLMLAHPHNLGRGETRQHHTADLIIQPLRAHTLGDRRTLRASALIVPQDRRAHNLVVRVEHRQAMHLPGQTHRRHVVGADFLQHRAQAGAGSSPPLARVLFRPERARR